MTGGPVSPLAAIRQKCLDCCCGQPSEVRLCPIERCPIHPFRMGTNPHRKRRELSDDERAALVLRLGARQRSSPEIQTQKAAGEGGAP